MTTAGAAAVAAPGPALPGVPIEVSAQSGIDIVPPPAEAVRETGSWFAHGTTLELLPDGSGTFARWVGAFDGDRIALRLIPAPGEPTVAEIIGIETVGEGALAPGARPGIGGLVTISFGEGVRTAHVEWTSGPERLSVDLCPAEGLDAATMETLRCGA